MEKEEKAKKKLGKWLDKLQQESWQLELVVSGFAIFLMAGAWNALDELNFMHRISNAGLRQLGGALGIAYLVVVVACLFIMINLGLHVLLRGLWISTIGLRYVSGEIDYDRLRLAPKFERFLKKRIGSFDQYILRLENICSVIFAFTFLIVFMVVGFGLFFMLLLAIVYFAENVLVDWVEGTSLEWLGRWGVRIVFISFMLAGLIYFIDFITLGFLKRKRWFSKVYFPIYRFLSFITLASLYRPMYYNLVDNKFGRRVGFLLVPYLIFIAVLFSFHIKSHIWFVPDDGELIISKAYYDDQRLEDQMVQGGSIPSKYVTNWYLELFIHYRPSPDDLALEILCPDFKHSKESGIGSDIEFSTSEPDTVVQNFSPPDSALICLSQLYEISVGDSIFEAPKFYFHEHKNEKEKGLLTILDLAYLPRGPQVVRVKKQVAEDEVLLMEDYFSIPFWVE